MIRQLCLLGLVLLLAGGCTLTSTTENDATPVAIPPQSFQRDWSARLSLEGDEVDRVFLREDVVIVYTKKHKAFVINKDSGVIRFHAGTISDSPIPPHEPVVLKDRIVFPTNNSLEIFRRDGRFENSYHTQNSLRTNASGLVAGSRIFFGVDTPGAGRMVAVETIPNNFQVPAQKWELMSDKGAPINGAPVAFSGIVYVAFDDGNVYAVNAETRQSIWTTSTGFTFKTYGPVVADLRADESGVYVPSTDSKFYCLDKTQGKIKWQYFAGSGLRASAEVTSSMVYLPVRNVGIVAIDKTVGGPLTREPRWVVRGMVKLVSEDEKYSYFQREDNIVVAIDKVTGEQKFTSKRTDLVAFATNIGKDGLIYASTRDGQVVRIKPVLAAGFTGEVAMNDWQNNDASIDVSIPAELQVPVYASDRR